MLSELLSSAPWPTQPGSRTAVGPLHGASSTLLIGELGAGERLLVVLTEDSSQAQVLARELPFFLDPTVDILQLPDWETLPYDNFSPHQDIVSERLRSLHRLPRAQRGVLIVPMSALLQRLPRGHYIEANSLSLCRGQQLDVDALREALTRSGYRSVPTVYEHGEFAVRGSLIDLYPMGSDLPLRIDLLDDEIDSLRCFDPETQRTLRRVDSPSNCSRRGSFPSIGGASGVSSRTGTPASTSTTTSVPCSRKSAPAAHRGAPSTTCPCSSNAARLLLDYLPPQRRWSPSVITTAPRSAFLRKRRGATRTSISTPAVRC
jgi:transcription-repair coupling factor (superfamily II helicase)